MGQAAQAVVAFRRLRPSSYAADDGTRGRSRLGRMRGRSRLWSGVLLLAMMVGCTVPGPPAPAESPTVVVSATPTLSDRDQRIHDAMERREAVVQRFTARPWQKRSWEQVSSGYLPDVERYQDRLSIAREESDERAYQDPSTVYAETGSIVVAAQRDPYNSESVSLFRWRGNELTMLFTLPWTNDLWMPKAVDGASIGPADARLTGQLIRYWHTGDLPSDVTLDPNGLPFAFGDNYDEPVKESRSCEVHHEGSESFAWSLPVEFGQLSLVAIDCRYRVRTPPDYRVGLPSDDSDITGNTKVSYRRLDCRWIYPMRVLVKDNGAVAWEHIGAQPMDVCTAS